MGFDHFHDLLRRADRVVAYEAAELSFNAKNAFVHSNLTVGRGSPARLSLRHS